MFIVVCPNTIVSKLVYDWIAGRGSRRTARSSPASRATSSCSPTSWTASRWPRPRTILIDSAQLESGEGMKADFKTRSRAEIAAFKAEYRRRDPGADVEKITDEELLREVMNTVGKKGKLGEHVRCVVSVSMLTEGWDANTVTHILGVRAFGSQLLCEQVVGRGLRRRIRRERGAAASSPSTPTSTASRSSSSPPTGRSRTAAAAACAARSRRCEGRRTCGSRFPKLTGYRVRAPDDEICLDLDAGPFEIGPTRFRRWVEMGGVIGSDERERGDPTPVPAPEVAFALAKRILDRSSTPLDDKRPWLFPRLVEMCREWIWQRSSWPTATASAI